MTAGAEARFAAAWLAAGAPRRLLLAVSGGGDSMALMRLAAPLARAGASISIATVDHGLRPGSSSDADFVVTEAAALGIPARILRWDGQKPASGVQAAARAARYRLLAAEAARTGADAILTAHTADDQAETLLMRMAHQTGLRGLGGMAGESFIADGAGAPKRLLRLLLGETREGLREFLAGSRAPFVDDPSNDDPRFERVRLRRMIAGRSDRQALVASLSALSTRTRALLAVSDRLDVLKFHRAGGAFLSDGGVRLAAFDDAHLAARLIHAVGAGDHAPSEEAAAAALAAALAGRRATLAGAIIEAVEEGLVLRREPAAVLGRAGVPGLGPLFLPPGQTILWDHRFAVENRGRQTVEVRPLGDAAKGLGGPALPAIETAPGLFVANQLKAFPGDEGAGDDAIRNLVPERFTRAVIRF